MDTNGNLKISFSSVAHLYLGCEVYDEEKPENTTAILDCIDTNGDCWYNFYDNNTLLNVEDTIMCGVEDIKPILKHLSDITEEDCNLLGFQDVDDFLSFMAEEGHDFLTAKDLFHLLSKGYDLYNLIDNGCALRK